MYATQEGAGVPPAGDSHEGQLGRLYADRRLEPDAAGEGSGGGARSSDYSSASATSPRIAEEEVAAHFLSTAITAAAATDDAAAEESYGPRRLRRASGMTSILNNRASPLELLRHFIATYLLRCNSEKCRKKAVKTRDSIKCPLFLAPSLTVDGVRYWLLFAPDPRRAAQKRQGEERASSRFHRRRQHRLLQVFF